MTVSVLLVDDDPTFLSLAERALAAMGIDVVATAENPVAAIEAANATKPGAALVDIGLPDREGIDLAYDLAALPWAPRVVLTSTDRDAGSALDGHEGGHRLPFVPKEELADGQLLRLLTAE
jgi:DNA-binding NarL/FixJ family response regulator